VILFCLVKECDFHFFKHVASSNLFKKVVLIFTSPYECLPGYKTLDVSYANYHTISALDLIAEEQPYLDDISSSEYKMLHLLGDQRYTRSYHKRYYWDINNPSFDDQVSLSVRIVRLAISKHLDSSTTYRFLTLSVNDVFKMSAIKYLASVNIPTFYLVHSHHKNHHILYTNISQGTERYSSIIAPIKSASFTWLPVKSPVKARQIKFNSQDLVKSQRSALYNTYFNIMFKFSFPQLANLIFSYWISIYQWLWVRLGNLSHIDPQLNRYFRNYTSFTRVFARLITSADSYISKVLINIKTIKGNGLPPVNVPYSCILLHMFPEATLIGETNNFVDEREWIFEIWKQLPTNHYLYVFEHPSMSWSGERSWSFYRYLKMLYNVKVIHTHKIGGTPIEYLRKASMVYTFAGSVALETSLLNIPCTTFVTRPYSNINSIRIFNERNNIYGINCDKYYQECQNYPDLDLDNIKWNISNVDIASLFNELKKLASLLA
jgi:hypothetical protein